MPPRNLTVTVTDKKGGLITGLTREAFTVLDGGRPSEVVSFAAGDAPATVGLLLDASGSANVARRGLVKTALTRFVKGCNPSDEFFLIAFNNAPQLVQGLTGDPADVLAALERYMAVRPWGQTALFDSLYVGLNQAEHGRYVRRAVVLLTDGQDNVSRYTFRELRRQLLESGVTVYAVGILDPNIDSALGYGGRAVLEDLAAASGGRAFFPESERDLNAAFEDLAAELRNQYVIGFTPSAGAAKKDGWHEVRVRLGGLQTGGKKLKVVARTRAGFYDVPPPRRD
ncbi:MAG: VWA domain-containing protein [Acidobacteria bacterium]|nr:VWA domain-containing protein [Acidobacteriota bacterium]